MSGEQTGLAYRICFGCGGRDTGILEDLEAELRDHAREAGGCGPSIITDELVSDEDIPEVEALIRKRARRFRD